VLGARPLALTLEEEIDAFRPIAEAPLDPESLIRDDPDVALFVQRLGDLGLSPDRSLLDFIARYMRTEAEAVNLRKKDPESERNQQIDARLKLLTDPETAGPRDRLLAALRSSVLRTELKLDPKWMLALMEKYGPIDWRTPFAHALYWASMGDMVTKGALNLDAADSMNTARFIFFALHNMNRQGRCILGPNWDEPFKSYIELLPDPRFIDALHQAYLEIGKEQDGYDPDFREGTSGPRYHVGHVNFLQTAVRELFYKGDEESLVKANKYYRWLRDYDLDQVTGEVKPQYLQPLEDFVAWQLPDLLETSKGATLFIGSWIDRSLKELSIGNLEAAEGYLTQAKRTYDKYMEDTKSDAVDRRKLERFPVIYTDIIYDFMRNPNYPVYRKIRLWRSLGLNARRRVYDRLLPFVVELCDKHDPPLDVNRAFPEPMGMEAFRAKQPKTRERSRGEVSEGTKDFDY
jgi:hypothetical protein